LHYPFV
jgi:hypothetical protein